MGYSNVISLFQELYRKWKEITMNSTSDQSKYRVWDYPIREQVAVTSGPAHGILFEGEGSVQLTSLYQNIQISFFFTEDIYAKQVEVTRTEHFLSVRDSLAYTTKL
jgi:hypothetical protein